MEVLLVILVFSAFGFCFYHFAIYNHTDHIKFEKDIPLKEDAKIISCKTEDVGGRRYQQSALRTTVVFEDGFKFISHKSASKQTGVLTFSISIDPYLKKEIISDAIKEHEKAFQNQNRS